MKLAIAHKRISKNTLWILGWVAIGRYIWGILQLLLSKCEWQVCRYEYMYILAQHYNKRSCYIIFTYTLVRWKPICLHINFTKLKSTKFVISAGILNFKQTILIHQQSLIYCVTVGVFVTIEIISLSTLMNDGWLIYE